MAVSSLPSGEVGVTFRNGWIRHLRVVLSSAGGVAIILGLFQLVQRQPGDSFRLLAVWGPWPVIGLVGLAILGKFLQRIADSIQSAFGAVVVSAQQGADAQSKTADALTRLADQGSQHAEEVRRLAMYAAQEFPSVYERFDRQDEVLGRLTQAVTALAVRGKDGN